MLKNLIYMILIWIYFNNHYIFMKILKIIINFFKKYIYIYIYIYYMSYFIIFKINVLNIRYVLYSIHYQIFIVFYTRILYIID